MVWFVSRGLLILGPIVVFGALAVENDPTAAGIQAAIGLAVIGAGLIADRCQR